MKTQKRFSKKRDAVIKVIRETKSHPSVEWVYGQLKPQFSDLSLGTVYRNIAQFKEEGSVVCVGVVNGQERYDANTEPHLHFICGDCASVIDIDLETDNGDLDSKVEARYGFKVDHHQTVIYGTCSDCQSRQRARFVE